MVNKRHVFFLINVKLNVAQIEVQVESVIFYRSGDRMSSVVSFGSLWFAATNQYVNIENICKIYRTLENDILTFSFLLTGCYVNDLSVIGI